MTPKALAELVWQLHAGHSWSVEQCQAFFTAVMGGVVAPELLADVLTCLARQGETIEEIVGAAAALRAHLTPVRVPADVRAIDTCGTGGDGKPTFNVSSAVAIVAAAAGATVAKHGNRSNARPSGSAEGLSALGIAVEAEVPVLERCLRECRVAFLFAQRLHPAMKHAGPVRKALGFRTIFNLVGPLANPARVARQLLGVPRPELVETMTHALAQLGSRRALVVHGEEGLCDLSISGPSRVGRLDGGRVDFETICAADLGIAPAPLEALFVASPAESATAIVEVLAGKPGPPRDAVILNAAAALWVAGECADWAEGLARSRAAIDSGAAQATLARWRIVSHDG